MKTRAVEFRGKKTATGKWVYGYPYSVDSESKVANFMTHIGNTFPVRLDSIGQNSGQKDTNDKVAFEGDILKIWMGRDKQDTPVILADLELLFYYLNRDDSYYRLTKFEIIGNVIDNPRLAEKCSVWNTEKGFW
jgi:YopX protein